MQLQVDAVLWTAQMIAIGYAKRFGFIHRPWHEWSETTRQDFINKARDALEIDFLTVTQERKHHVTSKRNNRMG